MHANDKRALNKWRSGERSREHIYIPCASGNCASTNYPKAETGDFIENTRPLLAVDSSRQHKGISNKKTSQETQPALNGAGATVGAQKTRIF